MFLDQSYFTLKIVSNLTSILSPHLPLHTFPSTIFIKYLSIFLMFLMWNKIKVCLISSHSVCLKNDFRAELRAEKKVTRILKQHKWLKYHTLPVYLASWMKKQRWNISMCFSHEYIREKKLQKTCFSFCFHLYLIFVKSSKFILMLLLNNSLDNPDAEYLINQA